LDAATRFASNPGGVVTDPIDPKYLTELPFGARSLWIQPWRAYMDTWPASRLIDSLGINFNVTPTEAEDTAQLLQESGFKLARYEIGWNSISYEHPSTFVNEASIDEELEALHKHHLRPLILLNANSGEPGPTKPVTLETTSEAPAGARTVTLTAASASQVVPGKTGFDYLTFGGNPDLLIASISGDTATLATPLLKALPPGAHKGATLLYAPFGPPELSNGESNPAFQQTLNGWLSYVSTIARKATSIFGPGGYDLEVWNELTFGSQFLSEANYYSPARETGEGSVTTALYADTVAYVRNPAHGISRRAGISNGFASQMPFGSGSLAPIGTTALSKALYHGSTFFPQEEINDSIMPLNALGEDESTITGPMGKRTFTPLFTPTVHVQMPEYFLTGIQTETLVRDIAPITTTIYGATHGRFAHPPGGPPVQIWMTEYNIGKNELFAESPEHPDVPLGHLDPAQAQHVQTEILLRSLVAMVNKGVAREYFYAATGASMNLVSESFMSAVNADSSAYPGSQLGGETTESFRRLLGRFRGPGPKKGHARQLRLLSIAQEGDHAQFQGNGTAADPTLYDREMLSVLPFQSSPTRFVIPVYVMSMNLTTINKPPEPENSIYRFDLPSEKFRITLGNLPETKAPPTVSAYDPIRDESTPARLVARRGTEAVFEIAATDYPRLLEIDYGA
jgi:hypothetical protein